MFEEYMWHCRNAFRIYGPKLFELLATMSHFNRWLQVQKQEDGNCRVCQKMYLRLDMM